MKNIVVILLIGLIGLVVGLGAYVIYSFIKPNNESVNVSGFGGSAYKYNFDSVFDAFASSDCESFITNQSIQSLNTELSEVENYSLQVGVTELTPLICYFKLSDDTKMILNFNAYTEDSEIDNNKEELFERINNNNLKQVLSNNEFKSVTYFFGSGENNNCITNMFHSSNDFEYAELVYLEESQCEELEEKNTIISQSIINIIDLKMNILNLTK